MGKKHCKLPLKEYIEKIGNKERFICPKCNRVAKKSKKLCKAKNIKLKKEPC